MSHLAQLRLLRVTAVGDNAAALDHAIAVLAGCEALDRRAVDEEHLVLMGPSGEEPSWSAEDVDATTLDGVIAAYGRARS